VVLSDETERVGVLVIRAWVEPADGTLVARLSGRTDVLADDETSVTVTGSDAVGQAVYDWLVAFERATR
jgi:hypothetical protein